MNYRFKTFEIFLLLVMLALFAYVNSMDNPFLFDDHDLFLQDRSLHSWEGVISWVVPKEGRFVYYRPLAHVVPGICYLLFYQNPFWYHLTNALLLAAASLAVFWGLRYIIGKELVALFAALLFCIHPVNGLLVNYITASVFSIQIAFMILSLCFFLKFCREEKFRLYWISLLFWAGSLLCHETAMAMPLYFLLALFFLVPKISRTQWAAAAGSFLILAGYFVFRLHFSRLQDVVFKKMALQSIGVWDFLAAFFHLIVEALKNVMVLKDIVFIRTIDVVNQGTFWPGLALMTIGIVVVAGVWRFRQRYPLASFGVAWYAMGFAPVVFACFVDPRVGLVYEPHWMFFANIGIFILAGLAVDLFMAKKKITAVVVAVGLFCACLVSGWRYNYLWGDSLRYLRYWSRFAPRYKGIYFWMAENFWDQGNGEKAEEYFLKSLDQTRLDWKSYANLGIIAMTKGDLSGAEQYLIKALTLAKTEPLPLLNLGVVAKKKTDYAAAKDFFQKVLAMAPDNVEARWELAEVLEQEGAWQEARTALMEAYQIDRSEKITLWLMVQFFLRHDWPAEAQGFARQFLDREQNSTELMKMASGMAMAGDYSTAHDFYKRALELDQENPTVYLEMGRFFGNYNQFNLATALWQKGAELFPEQRQEFESLIAQAQALKEQGY